MAQGQLTSPWEAKDPDTVHTDRRVGIGTSNPLMPLHVVGDAWVGNRLFARELHAQDSMSIGTFRFSNAGDSDSILTAAGRALVISAGLTRIGTGPFSLPVPTGLALDIAGDVRAQGANFEVLKIGSSIRMGETDQGNEHTLFSDNGDLLINTHADSDGFHTILNAGANNNNVGIGVLTPSEKLHVGGNIRIDNLSGANTVLVEADDNGVLSGKGYSNDANDVLRGDGTWAPSPFVGNAWELTGNAETNPLLHFIGTTDAQDLSFRTNDAERMRVTQDGMVGIGRDNPQAPLHVNGSALISHRTGIGVGNPQKMLHVKTRHTHVVEWGGGGGVPVDDDIAALLDEILNTFDDAAAIVGDAVVDSNNNVICTIDTATGEIRNTGDTLIGVIAGSPAHQEHSSHYGLRLEDVYGMTPSGMTPPASIWDIWPHGESGKMHVSNPQTEDTVLTINDAGNVGLGTTTPQAKLDIIGNIRIEATNAQAGYVAGNNSPYIYAAASSFPGGSSSMFGSLVLQSRSSASRPILFITGQSPQERMRVSGNGNVGIGTTNPQYKLDVAGNTHVSGKLGVGTTDIPSGYKLAVNGPMIVERIKVRLKNDWPDYAFSENYKRMNIGEKAQFYSQHHRLPHMPTGEKMKEEGMDVEETMAGVTLNVEENRLDITDLHKQMQQLHGTVEELKRENEALKEKVSAYEEEKSVR